MSRERRQQLLRFNYLYRKASKNRSNVFPQLTLNVEVTFEIARSDPHIVQQELKDVSLPSGVAIVLPGILDATCNSTVLL